MFPETVKKRIEDPQGELTCLISLTGREGKALVKPFIHDRPRYGFVNGMRVLETQYENPGKLPASYKNDIKKMTKN